MEAKAEQVAQGEFKGETLQHVCRCAHCDEELSLAYTASKDGTLRVWRGDKDLRTLASPEAWRVRMMVLGHARSLLELRFPGRPVLKRRTP